MSEEESDIFDAPDPPEPDDPADGAELPAPESPEVPQGEEEKPPTVSVEDFAALKQQVTELLMKQRRDDDVEQPAARDGDTELHLLVARLQEEVEELRAKQFPTPPDSDMDPTPISRIFPAEDDGTDVTEQVVSGGTIAAYVDGRTFPTTAAVTLSDDQAFYVWMYDASDNKMQPVKIPTAAAPDSRAKLVYITADLTCGGVYEGYIVSDLAGLMVTTGFDSSASTFDLADILYDAPGISGTDAEVITIINDDEEGLTTHALTASTQIKHLYIAYDTGNTDDDQSDRRVFIITDTDNEECEEA